MTFRSASTPIPHRGRVWGTALGEADVGRGQVAGAGELVAGDVVLGHEDGPFAERFWQAIEQSAPKTRQDLVALLELTDSVDGVGDFALQAFAREQFVIAP